MEQENTAENTSEKTVRESGNGAAIPFGKRTAEFKEKAAALGHDLQDLKKITGEMTSEAIHALSQNASEYYDQGLKKAKQIEKDIERSVQDKPVRYLLIAAGIGLVAGALFGWRTTAMAKEEC